MNSLNSTNPFGDETKFITKKDNKLSKYIGIATIVVSSLFAAFEGVNYLNEYKNELRAEKFNRFEAVGGRTYEGMIIGYTFNSPEDKLIKFIELLGSDERIYLNHSQLPNTSLRTKPIILDMNRTIFKSLEKTETSFLSVDVTQYVNPTTKERINVMMSAKIIPPLEAPKPDMDTERTIFRHPDTYEVIPKYLYEEIMLERKLQKEFEDEVLKQLNKKPKEISKYTEILTLKI